MEITEEVLSTLRKAINDEYDEQLDVHDTLTNSREILESLRTLSLISGEIKILEFLECVLHNDQEAIEVLNDYLH